MILPINLNVSDLLVKRGEIPLIQSFSVNLVPHDCCMLTGPNGSGKTTLLRTIAGLLKPSEGKVDLNTDSESKPMIAYHGHQDALTEQMTVIENLIFYQKLYKSDSVQMDSLIQKFAIDYLNQPVSQLSAGQKKRASLCCQFLAKASLWIFDEPATNLDQNSINVLTQEIERLKDRGAIVLIATHSPQLYSYISNLNVSLEP